MLISIFGRREYFEGIQVPSTPTPAPDTTEPSLDSSKKVSA